jgi:S-DNA-T family DNA segregation ATPase FtsK/SpoIIIE
MASLDSISALEKSVLRPITEIAAKLGVTPDELELHGRFKAKLPLALGKDVYGNTIVGDLASMPHLLVAGATGSGKSVCINSIISSLLFQFTPEQLRFIMVDPKVVEMQHYNDLPHLVIPVVTDPKKTLTALNWVVNEMEARYRVFADQKRVRGQFPQAVRRREDGSARPSGAASGARAAAATVAVLAPPPLVLPVLEATGTGTIAPSGARWAATSAVASAMPKPSLAFASL